MKKRDKILICVTSVVMLLTLIFGYSFAFWTTTKVQDDYNVITALCFKFTLVGENPTDLSGQFPITDDEGMEQTPYTFTIKNTCDTKESYQLNLESLAASTFQDDTIKIAFNNTIKLYSELPGATKFLDDSKSSKKLITGELEKDEEVTYSLRMWIKNDAPETEQEKRFETKVVVTTIEPETNNEPQTGDPTGTGGEPGTN